MTDTRIERASLAAGIRELLEEEAQGAFPEEACGLLVGRVEGEVAQVEGAVPCPNEAEPERRRNRFSIDPRRVIEEERSLRGAGRAIVGFYHSHPVGEAIPSGVDRGYMENWPDAVWVIVGEGSPRVRAWGWDEAAPDRPRRIPIEGGGGEDGRGRGVAT